MKYLHNKKIFHRNLKLSNILLKFDDEEDKSNLMKAKIILNDFYFSRYLEKGQKAKTILGSPLYMPPIILNKLTTKPNENDILQ